MNYVFALFELISFNLILLYKKTSYIIDFEYKIRIKQYPINKFCSNKDLHQIIFEFSTKIKVHISIKIRIINWKPPSQSELTPMIFNKGLTHLGSKVSRPFLNFKIYHIH